MQSNKFRSTLTLVKLNQICDEKRIVKHYKRRIHAYKAYGIYIYIKQTRSYEAEDQARQASKETK